VIRLDSLFVSIRCLINKAPFDALYNPVVGVNIMSASFAHELLKDMPLASTKKLLKGLQDTFSQVWEFFMSFLSGK
jgi:hypothetical protein